MRLQQVRDDFDEVAWDYEALITRIIPRYHEQNAVIASLIPFPSGQPFLALDLGCGTGALAGLVLKRFRAARVVALDLAANMVRACEANLTLHKDRLSVRQADFGTDDLGHGYDLVVSGLAIHHLPDPEKQALFRRLFAAMNPGGVFINRDRILGSAPAERELLERQWREFIRENRADDVPWVRKHLDEDIPATLDDQLSWLSEAGFRDVQCYWQHLNFAIFGGRKG